MHGEAGSGSPLLPPVQVREDVPLGECRVGLVRTLYLVLVRRRGAHLTRHL
jgi:hypothetical protein